MPPNHYLAVAIDYLFQHRRHGAQTRRGQDLVSSTMIDRVAAGLGRTLSEVPVGFKWFVDGLLDGSLGFGGEESAGASFLRRDGSVWTTDKDGIIAGAAGGRDHRALGRDPGEIYRELTRELWRAASTSASSAGDAGAEAALASCRRRTWRRGAGRGADSAAS